MEHLCIVCREVLDGQVWLLLIVAPPCYFRATGIKHMLRLQEDLVKVFMKYIYYLISFNFINHSLFYSTIF